MSEVYTKAVRLLARRDHSAFELQQKLLLRGATQPQIEEALSRCQALNFQNDERFVMQFVQLRYQQGYGPLKIQQELRAKGVVAELITQELRSDKYNWATLAAEVWRKKERQLNTKTQQDRQKVHRFLLYRGFSGEIIAAIMRQEL